MQSYFWHDFLRLKRNFDEFVNIFFKGKTLEEAQNISNQEIVDILELPAIKIHCSVLAEEAIHRAIDDFKSLRNND